VLTASSTPYEMGPEDVGACRDGRLTRFDFAFDFGSYKKHERSAIEFAVRSQSHVQGDIFVQFVPHINFNNRVTHVTALRYNLAERQWLPSSEYTIAPTMGQLPVQTDVFSVQRSSDHLLVWKSWGKSWQRKSWQRTAQGARFSAVDGTWTAADASDDLDNAKGKGGRMTHPAYPPSPEPTTGVVIELDATTRTAQLRTRDGGLVGTVQFPTSPGAYVGFFENTGTAFFWGAPYNVEALSGSTEELPLEFQFHSYLVDVATGRTCQVPEALDFEGSLVYRLGKTVLFINAHQTEQQRSICPPGAACMAPEKPYFTGASGVVFEDFGP
jgi:hypothetical protein